MATDDRFRKLRFDNLESRIAFAGNVTAENIAGDLAHPVLSSWLRDTRMVLSEGKDTRDARPPARALAT